MLLLFIMLIFGSITAAVAAGKGRSAIGWFLIGAMFPLPGLIIACTLKPNLEAPNQLS
jgi:hypothetical protein